MARAKANQLSVHFSVESSRAPLSYCPIGRLTVDAAIIPADELITRVCFYWKLMVRARLLIALELPIRERDL